MFRTSSCRKLRGCKVEAQPPNEFEQHGAQMPAWLVVRPEAQMCARTAYGFQALGGHAALLLASARRRRRHARIPVHQAQCGLMQQSCIVRDGLSASL